MSIQSQNSVPIRPLTKICLIQHSTATMSQQLYETMKLKATARRTNLYGFPVRSLMSKCQKKNMKRAVKQTGFKSHKPGLHHTVAKITSPLQRAGVDGHQLPSPKVYSSFNAENYPTRYNLTKRPMGEIIKLQLHVKCCC